jgi:hypothetical protein
MEVSMPKDTIFCGIPRKRQGISQFQQFIILESKTKSKAKQAEVFQICL